MSLERAVKADYPEVVEIANRAWHSSGKLVQYMQSILYRASAADPAILLIPFLIITTAAIGAAAPAFFRARHINPVGMLRVN